MVPLPALLLFASLPDSVLLRLEVSDLQKVEDAKELMSCEHPSMREHPSVLVVKYPSFLSSGRGQPSASLYMVSQRPLQAPAPAAWSSNSFRGLLSLDAFLQHSLVVIAGSLPNQTTCSQILASRFALEGNQIKRFCVKVLGTAGGSWEVHNLFLWVDELFVGHRGCAVYDVGKWRCIVCTKGLQRLVRQ